MFRLKWFCVVVVPAWPCDAGIYAGSSLAPGGVFQAGYVKREGPDE
jgi:hypothetical protein